MGYEARNLKDRSCKHCNQTFYQTAKQIAEHADLCQRATQSGLVLPGAVIRTGKGYSITKLDAAND